MTEIQKIVKLLSDEGFLEKLAKAQAEAMSIVNEETRMKRMKERLEFLTCIKEKNGSLDDKFQEEFDFLEFMIVQ